MRKQFVFNIVLLIALNLLIKTFWILGIDLRFQNLIGSREYGLYFALFNFSILFNSLLDLGITNFNNRSISQNPSLLGEYFPKLIIAKSVLGIVYLCFTLLVAIFAGYSSFETKLLFILAINQLLASFLLYFRSNISGMQLYTTDSIISVVDRSIMILLGLIFIWGNIFHMKIGVMHFALFQTVAYLITCIIAVSVIVVKSGNLTLKNASFFPGDLVKKCLPFALLVLLMSIYSRTDAVIIERILPDGKYWAGIYAQSFRFFDAVSMLAVLFASLLLPMFSKLLSDKQDIKPLLTLAFRLMFSGLLIFVVHAAFYSSTIIHLFYKDFQAASAVTFGILMISLFPAGMMYIFGTLLTANGSLKTLNIIALLTLVLNLILNFILIPIVGIIGAAITVLITQSVSCGLQTHYCIRFFKIKITYADLVRYLTFIILCLFVTFIFSKTNLKPWFSAGISFSVSLLLIFFLKLIDIQSIIRIYKESSLLNRA